MKHPSLLSAALVSSICFAGCAHAMNQQAPSVSQNEKTGKKLHKKPGLAFRKRPIGNIKTLKTLSDATLFLLASFVYSHICNQLPASQANPLIKAIENDQTNLFKILYRHCCNMFNEQEPFKTNWRGGATLLERAIEKRNVQITKVILKSWKESSHLFDTTTDSQDNNIFHRVLLLAKKDSPADRVFFNTIIKKLLRCLRCNWYWLIQKNKTDKTQTPLDIAFEKGLDEVLFNMVRFIIQKNQNNYDEFLPKVIDRAQDGKRWKLIVKFINAYPQVTSTDAFKELAARKDEALFYQNLFFHGLKPRTAIPNTESGKNMVNRLERLYHKPKITNDTLYLWENIQNKPKKANPYDMQIVFKK